MSSTNQPKGFGGVSRLPIDVGYELGWGVDLITGNLSVPAVSSEHTSTRSAFTENRHIQVVTTSDEYRSLSRSVLSAQASGWGASFSSGVDYLRSQQMNSQSVNFVMGATITLDQQLLDFGRVDVSQDILDDLKTMKEEQRLGDFVAKYGTHFIGGFMRGGYFLGSFNLQASTRQSAEELKVEFSASFSSFVSGSVSGSFQRSLQSLSSQYRVNASATINGGVPELFDPTQPETMKTALNSFSTQLKANGASPLVALCYEWQILPQVREIIGDERLLPNISDNVIEALQEAYLSLDYALDTIEQIRAAGSWVGASNEHRLAQLRALVMADCARIESLTLAELAALDTQDPSFASTFQTADAYIAELRTIAAGQVTISWRTALDGAFHWTGARSGELTVRPSSDPVSLIETTHRRADGENERVWAGFRYGRDRKLRAYLNLDAGDLWHFDGEPTTENRSESKAIETRYPWNYFLARFE